MQINGCNLQHNVDWKKLNQKEFILFNSTFIKFKNKQNQFMVLEVKLVLFWMIQWIDWAMRRVTFVSIILFLDLCVNNSLSYIFICYALLYMYFIVQKVYFKNPHMLIVSKMSFFFLLLLFVEHDPNSCSWLQKHVKLLTHKIWRK